MNLAPVLRQRFLDANGLPLNGGLLYSYAAGTTTPLVTYSNATGTSNTNPVVLDSSGYADVWLDPTLAYKLVLKDSGGSTLWTVDNVTFAVGISAWNANAIYQTGQMVTDSSGAGLMYVSLIDNNQNQPLTNVSAWRMFQGNVRTVSINTTLVVTDELVRSNSTSGSLTMTLPACSTTPVGKRILIKDVGTGGNTTTVKGSGADLVDGNNTWSATLSRYAAAMFVNNGTSWDTTTQVLANGVIVAANIASSAVTGAKLDTTAADASTLEVASGSMRIKDLGVSTAKIAAGAVTPAKLAARNYAISSNYNQTVGGTGNLIGLAATITTTGRPVLYMLVGTGTATASHYISSDAGATITVAMDGTTITTFEVPVGVTYPPSAFADFHVPSAASHTYQVTVSANGGNISVSNVSIVAIEL